MGCSVDGAGVVTKGVVDGTNVGAVVGTVVGELSTVGNSVTILGMVVDDDSAELGSSVSCGDGGADGENDGCSVGALVGCSVRGAGTTFRS